MNPIQTKKSTCRYPVAAFIGGLSSQVVGGLVGAAVMQGLGEQLIAWAFQLYALAALILIVLILSVRAIARTGDSIGQDRVNNG